MGIVLGANEGTVRLHNAVPRIFFIYTYKMHLKIVCMGGAVLVMHGMIHPL